MELNNQETTTNKEIQWQVNKESHTLTFTINTDKSYKRMDKAQFINIVLERVVSLV